jgi:hypothetical protein
VLKEFLPIRFGEGVDIRDYVAVVLCIADDLSVTTEILGLALAPSHREGLASDVGIDIEFEVTVGGAKVVDPQDAFEQVTSRKRPQDRVL